MSGYTTQEVSALLGLKPHQVRHYVRRDLLRPDRGDKGEFRFSFQDVVLLRTAKICSMRR
ncbi:MAG: MerR family transcriptional regulator [Pseudomonadales bacterium]